MTSPVQSRALATPSPTPTGTLAATGQQVTSEPATLRVVVRACTPYVPAVAFLTGLALTTALPAATATPLPQSSCRVDAIDVGYAGGSLTVNLVDDTVSSSVERTTADVILLVPNTAKITVPVAAPVVPRHRQPGGAAQGQHRRAVLCRLESHRGSQRCAPPRRLALAITKISIHLGKVPSKHALSPIPA